MLLRAYFNRFVLSKFTQKHPFAIKYGTINQSNPFIRKKKKPAHPSRLNHILNLLWFSIESYSVSSRTIPLMGLFQL